MDEALIRRIEREAGVTGLADALTKLSPTDLQSLLLEVHRRRARRLAPDDVLRQYASNRFVRPSPVDPGALLALDRLAFEVLPTGYERIEVGPVGPLGATAVLAPVHQNWMVSTVRNTEVVGDSTIMLALECARRRRSLEARRSRSPVRLCSSHRVMRAQAYDDPNLRSHFRLIALCAAGRDLGGHRFETEHLAEQIGFYLHFITAAAEAGLAIDALRVSLTHLVDGVGMDQLEEQVVGPLSSRFPAVGFAFDRERRQGPGYYIGACFAVHVGKGGSRGAALVDGGFTDWTQRLLSDRKERLLTSGVGTEALQGMFGPFPSA
jgi:hypothetical protein